jgi:hypothetical protein
MNAETQSKRERRREDDYFLSFLLRDAPSPQRLCVKPAPLPSLSLSPCLLFNPIGYVHAAPFGNSYSSSDAGRMVML